MFYCNQFDSFRLMKVISDTKDAVGMETIMTVNGRSITVTVKDGKTMVDDAMIVKTDILWSDGHIHLIDGVFVPKLACFRYGMFRDESESFFMIRFSYVY